MELAVRGSMKKKASQAIRLNESGPNREMTLTTMKTKTRMKNNTNPLYKTQEFQREEDRTKPLEHLFWEIELTFEESIRNKNKWIDCLFLYSLIWAFGAILKENARREFNSWLHQQIEKKDLLRMKQNELSEENSNSGSN